ncbi:hypothetical protein GCM10010912_36860 [Paenibacillus albidus]|uniref:DUF4352 domain-containing protein n=1 Tax=Paenibacillus albidus TaxID=2041023 RepID=A0A917CGD1_9BACL|nr:hypothetical protein [Paenibacillus albidus]GGF88224.1 hypothetical protein GCM10010912_36860 [Paenibacillus albidus]
MNKNTNKPKFILLGAAMSTMLLLGACGTKSNSEGADVVNAPPTAGSEENTVAENQPVTSTASPDTNITEPTVADPSKPENTENTPASEKPANTDSEILVVIDQTAKPSEGNSFDFFIEQLPSGFMLAEMQWVSKENLIVNSREEAIQHGGDGEDGFYISGNGQFSGFIYPDSMKGEKGEVVILFKNEQGKELTWKKEITLK